MVWGYGTFPQHLALIRLMVSQKVRVVTPGRRTPDDGRPRHNISSADSTVVEIYWLIVIYS